MRVLLTSLFLFLLACTPRVALAWGFEGHRIICSIAWDEMTDRSRSKVQEILGLKTKEQFAEECTWADVYRRDHPQTSPWHFVNVPAGATRIDLRRDCSGPEGCATAQVELRIKQLRVHDPSIDKAFALRVLLHSLGDEHQPLHVTEANGDKGGNQLHGKFLGKETNFHAVWDSRILAAEDRPWQDEAVDLERKIAPQQRRRWTSGSHVSWADESLAISLDPATQYVGQKNGFDLGEDYQRDHLPVVTEQLSRAGVRLGYLLNDIFAASYRR